MTDTPAFADILHQHGERWQIELDPEIGVWTAVERPTPTALHVVCAHDLASLAAKLNAAADRGTG